MKTICLTKMSEIVFEEIKARQQIPPKDNSIIETALGYYAERELGINLRDIKKRINGEE